MKNMEKNSERFKETIKGNENNPDILHKAEMESLPQLIDGIDTVTLKAVVDHIVHIVDIGGIQCVGLGSDFDGIPSTPIDLMDVSCYPALIEGLSFRGFTEKEIQKIMSLNLFHFLKQFDH